MKKIYQLTFSVQSNLVWNRLRWSNRRRPLSRFKNQNQIDFAKNWTNPTNLDQFSGSISFFWTTRIGVEPQLLTTLINFSHSHELSPQIALVGLILIFKILSQPATCQWIRKKMYNLLILYRNFYNSIVCLNMLHYCDRLHFT